MGSLLPAFKFVSLTFATTAVITGIQAILDPAKFSRSFGIPISRSEGKTPSTTKAGKARPTVPSSDNDGAAYVALMGVRQLATGMTLFTFAYEQKWTEMATILAILGFVVAGTDGIYLARSGDKNKAAFHAVPGALIAILASFTAANSK